MARKFIISADLRKLFATFAAPPIRVHIYGCYSWYCRSFWQFKGNILRSNFINMCVSFSAKCLPLKFALITQIYGFRITPTQVGVTTSYLRISPDKWPDIELTQLIPIRFSLLCIYICI